MHSPTTRSCTCTVVVATASAATQLERCIADVGRWMSGNRLKLNTDKAELSDLDTVFTSTTFVCQNYILVMTQSYLVTMSVCWEQRSRPILASIDTSPSSAPRHAVSSDTRPLIRVVTRRLLQRSYGGCAESDDDKLQQQVMNVAARVITGTHCVPVITRAAQVRPRTVADIAH